MTPNYWANTEEDTGPIIDKILDHRPADGIGIRNGPWSHSLLTVCRA